MKSIRYPLLIAIAIFIVLLGFGSAYDLEIAKVLFRTEGFAHGYAIFLSSTAMFISYAIYPIFGGFLFYITLKNKFNIWLKIFFYLISAACYVTVVVLSGKEVFGVNGYNKPNLVWIGYVIAVVVEASFCLLGWFVGKKINNKDMWLPSLISMILIFIIMMFCIIVFKEIFHRPRFRYLINEDFMSFVPWWKSVNNHRELLVSFSPSASYITKEEFKSFPSGHAGVSTSIMMMASALPLLGKKYAKLQPPAFVLGFIWTLLVSLARMIAGAHYLSDVSMGAALNLIWFFGLNEFMIGNKKMRSIIQAQLEKE